MSALSLSRLSQGLGLLLGFSMMQSFAQAQETKTTPYLLTQNSNVVIEENIVTPVNQTETLLSIEGGQRLIAEAQEAVNKGDYDLAATKLQQARRVFNQLSNFYSQLVQSFSGIDNRITEDQRAGALRTAMLRDEATYKLALVHRAQNKPELAVPLLIQIIGSQNPTSELGRKSYQQLYEIGFVSAPFERAGN